MEVNLYTVFYNEHDIIPFVVQYWQQMRKDGIDLNVIAWNNLSTDDSVEMLSKYDWIRIEHFNTGGEMNDKVLALMRNSIWMEAKADKKVDFVIVCDMDEIMYSKHWLEELNEMKRQQRNIMANQWFCLIGDSVPKFDENQLLHKQIKYAYKQRINHDPRYSNFGKFILFDPHKIDSMNYSVGSHICNPKPDMKLYYSKNVYTFHINKNFGIDYKYEQTHKQFKRLSQDNLNGGMCLEYGNSFEQMKKEYDENKSKSINIETL